jgi:alkanesulfonate monooxygenase SsuD/methylene tetrahydromethanopterin reductase-like flavin-dependent oxidoreductase (luciferase family)
MVTMATATELAEARKFAAAMADGLMVCKADGTPDPEATAELTEWLRHRAAEV